MICPSCHGTGKLTGRIGGVDHTYPQLPCAECGGSGVSYCCDGEDYDGAADAKGCYDLAISVIGERVRAGEAVPRFLLSEKPDPDKPATAGQLP